jgi:hypothetical protein
MLCQGLAGFTTGNHLDAGRTMRQAGLYVLNGCLSLMLTAHENIDGSQLVFRPCMNADVRLAE